MTAETAPSKSSRAGWRSSTLAGHPNAEQLLASSPLATTTYEPAMATDVSTATGVGVADLTVPTVMLCPDATHVGHLAPITGMKVASEVQRCPLEGRAPSPTPTQQDHPLGPRPNGC